MSRSDLKTAATGLHLQADGWDIDLCPLRGGSVLSCRYKGRDILRPAPAGWRDDPDPFKTSAFALFPYSNRIGHGELTFDAETFDIAPNVDGHIHPLHGTGWLGAWRIVAMTDNVCELAFSQAAAAGEWPWPFEARQKFTLIADTLIVELTLTNTGPTRMPAGLGWHPYFPSPEKARLQFEASGIWAAAEDKLPKELIALPEPWDFSKGRAVKGAGLDHCFAGWNGSAVINWTDFPHDLVIQASKGLDFAVVYTPDTADEFCFEPVSHMNNAVQWTSCRSDTGLEILAPGQSLSETIILRIQ